MILLDHTVLRVRNQRASIRFYEQVLGFPHEGRAEPFEVMRVNDGLTLDLMEETPTDVIHLAFALSGKAFANTGQRLESMGVPYGDSPHSRKGGPPGCWFGARGLADTLYFNDPDGHILEIRYYSAE